MHQVVDRSLPAGFREFAGRQELIRSGDSIVVAVSGGVDSRVLLELFAILQDELRLTIRVAHFNHGLRGPESDGDEAFVAELATKGGWELYAQRADVTREAERAGRGIQETARILRYQFLEGIRGRAGARTIATGHHADDNAETILLHVIRGTGTQGLRGIPVSRDEGRIIRPLLFATRSEIETFARDRGLSWREDSSNAHDDYARNVLRHTVMPAISTSLNPGLAGTLARTGEFFGQVDELLSVLAGEVLDRATTGTPDGSRRLAVDALQAVHPAIRYTIVHRLVAETTGTPPGIRHVQAILGLAEQETGTCHELSGSFSVFRDREHLVIRKTRRTEHLTINIGMNASIEGDGFRVTVSPAEGAVDFRTKPASVEYVDRDAVQATELRLRTWQPGDTFYPLGMTSPRKISDHLIDRHVPLFDKQRFPVLETPDGRVVCLCGQRIDNRFRVTPSTRHLLKIEYHRRPDPVHA